MDPSLSDEVSAMTSGVSRQERSMSFSQENEKRKKIKKRKIRNSFPSEPVCYLSLETVFNTFHSVLLVAEIADAKLAQVKGIC